MTLIDKPEHMKLQLHKDIFAKYPQLKVAFILATPIAVNNKFSESRHLLREAETLVHLTFNRNNFQSHDLISPWMVARQEFGQKAPHYHTSVEHLLKRVLARKRIAGNTTVTNLVSYLSLKHIVPMTVDDPDKIIGTLTFALAVGPEKKNLFRRLEKGALYYHDEKKVLGMKLDYWKNPRVALSSTSISALIHIEVLPPVTSSQLQAMVKETQQLIKTFCGGKSKVVVLDRKKRTASL